MRAVAVTRDRAGGARGRLPLAVRLAETGWETTRGLLGRPKLADGEGMWLPECGAVHTCFMRQVIDAVFIDAGGRVVRVAEGLRPWRFAGARGARSVLELADGAVRRLDLRVGDRLEVADDANGNGNPRPRPEVPHGTDP